MPVSAAQATLSGLQWLDKRRKSAVRGDDGADTDWKWVCCQGTALGERMEMGARARVLEREHKMVLPIMPGRVQGLVYSCNPSTKKAKAGGSLGVEACSHGSSRAVTELLFLQDKTNHNFTQLSPWSPRYTYTSGRPGQLPRDSKASIYFLILNVY